MPSLDEMRAELRELKRKAGSAISKLKKEDVQRQLDLYRSLTQENEATPTKKKHGRTMPSREMVVEKTVQHGDVAIKVPKMSVTTKKGKEALAKATPAGGAGAPVKRKKVVEVEVTDSESEEEIVVKRKPGKKVVYVESDEEGDE